MIWFLAVWGACTGGGAGAEDSAATDDSATTGDDGTFDPSQPHFVLTVNGTRYDWREAWSATSAGGADGINVGAADDAYAPDRTGLDFMYVNEVGTLGCADLFGGYWEVRGGVQTGSWPTSGEGAACELTVTAASDVEGEPVAGTFAFTLPPAPGSPEGTPTIEITDGSFLLPYGTSPND